MLYPVHFEDSRPRKAETFMPSLGKKISTTTNGQRACWLTTLQDFPGDRPFRDTPGAFSCINGRLDFYSWAATSRPYVGMAPRPISVELMDPSQFLHVGSNRQYPESPGWVSQSDREVHAAAFGQLVTLPWGGGGSTSRVVSVHRGTNGTWSLNLIRSIRSATELQERTTTNCTLSILGR